MAPEERETAVATVGKVPQCPSFLISVIKIIIYILYHVWQHFKTYFHQYILYICGFWTEEDSKETQVQDLLMYV